MSLLNALFDEPVRLGSKLEIDSRGALVTVAGFSKRIEFDCTKPDEDLTRFRIWAVRPPSNAESAIVEIKGGDRSSTLGYVFPVNTFSLDSDYAASKLEGKYKGLFSSVACIGVCQAGLANTNVVFNFDQLPNEIPLREIFSEDLAIVVLGDENLARAGCTAETARLLLQEAGYFVVDVEQGHKHRRPRPNVGAGMIRLGGVSASLVPSCQVMERLIALAAVQTSTVSALLMYYQVVEIVSEKLLLARLRVVAGEVYENGFAFKQRLSKISTEQSRVTAICEMSKLGGDAAVFEGMAAAGEEFLKHCGVKIQGKSKAPGMMLYKVRNIIVHNQAVIDEPGHLLLGQFVDKLHGAVGAMIRRFDPNFEDNGDDAVDEQAED